MNVLFLTIAEFNSIEQHAIYPDLLRVFRDMGHSVYSVSSYEKRLGKETELIEDHNTLGLHVKIGNITKCGVIEKGISTLMIEAQYKNAIKKYFSDVKFDLVLYSTPPITLVKVVEFIKKRDGAKSYLLLKDIFPQNAVDIGMMKKTGLKGLLYHFFRAKEKKLYEISDYIGCMSPANVEYVLKNNPEISPDRVEVCPNSVEIRDMSVNAEDRRVIREKYGIPLDKKVFIYGGNLGRPQGIPHLIECLKAESGNTEAFFLIVGDGTEYGKLEQFVKDYPQDNFKLLKKLPKEDYDRMVGACNVGMIFLDHRFTIPNFPSRLLSYTQAKMPVLAVTDPNTDIGKIAEEGGFGIWCESNSVEQFSSAVRKMLTMDLKRMGERGFEYTRENYGVEDCYRSILTKVGRISATLETV